jgi:hypothetical protein
MMIKRPLVIFALVTAAAALFAAFAVSHPDTPPNSAAKSQASSAISSLGALVPRAQDPTSGRPFADAAEASAAAGGYYVPDCAGHGTYYLQATGVVVAVFPGSDVHLSVSPPGGSFVAGPIKGNSVVTPRVLSVQGQEAYGYDATPQIVDLPTPAPDGATREGVLLRSYISWNYRGSSMALSSAAQLSLAGLQKIAGSCK